MPDSESVDVMWKAFADAHPELVDETTTYEAWHFCDNKADADELVELARIGVKRATAGLLWAYEVEGGSLPQVGDFSVITDWDERARCIIRTTSVEVVPFDEVTAGFAATEGEGDGSLEYWRAAHRAAFGRELSALGMALERDMPVVCECFEVVYGADPRPPER